MSVLRGGASVLCLAACLSQPAAPPPHAASEDALRFRSVNVDLSLPDVDAIGYDVDLRVSGAPGRETFSADAKGVYVATRDLTELALDFDGNVVDAVSAGGAPASFRRDGKLLVITLPSALASGQTLTTRVRYHGDVFQADRSDPNDFAVFGGLDVRQRNLEGKRIFSSLDWPGKTRRWLPVRDHPRDGAMLAMNLTFPSSFTVLSNGTRTGRDDNDDGTTTWHYEALTPMPTYAFHLAAYESWKSDETRSASGVPITTYTYAGAEPLQRAIYGDIGKAVDFYESAFGKYRWGSLGFVEEPIFSGAMEHATVISMGESLFKNAAEARTTAFHELAHHWSGNLVRMRSWNDFWLSEGFSEYLTARFIAVNDGAAAQKSVLRDYLKETLDAERANPHPVRPPDPEVDPLTIFDAISYQKGALVLRALERVVGAEALTTFLRGWFERHAFGAVSTFDFERELAAASGQDLRAFFAGFVYGSYHPEVRVTFAAVAGGGGDVEIRVDQLQAKGPAGGFAFPLDVDLVDARGHAERFVVDVNGKNTTKRVRPAHVPQSLVVDPDEMMLGTLVCDASCRDGFRCAAGAVRVCVPR